MRLGTELRERRKAVGLPRTELARRVGVTPAYIYLVEGAKRRKRGEPSRPSQDVLRRWASALGMEEPYVRQILLLAGYESPQEERRPAGREEPTRGARFAAPPVRFPLSKELQRDVLHGQLGEVLQRAQEADRWEETVDLADSLLDWLAFRSGRGGAMSREPLIPRFAKYLWCFSPDEHLVTALDYMRENDFSQIVVRQEGQLTVLTTEGTAGWLERHAHARPLSLAEARVGDALAHDVPDSAMVMGAAHSVADALAAFTGFLKQGRPRLYAIIITERGTHREEPIGIVTPWDLLGEARGG